MIRVWSSMCRVTALWCAFLGATLSGCQVTPNMFHDEFSAKVHVTTPSVDGIRAVQVAPVERQRPYGSALLEEADGAVAHLPLFFETHLEDWGDGDGTFRWTTQDYFQFLIGRGRFVISLFAFPLSAVDTPPWQLMESDGHPNRVSLAGTHDAAAACKGKRKGAGASSNGEEPAAVENPSDG